MVKHDVFICRDCAEICIGVFASYDPEWRDLQTARLANEGCSAKAETIYVWLPEEGVDVSRPVTAQPVQDDLYRLIDTPPEGEVWEFHQGDTVRSGADGELDMFSICSYTDIPRVRRVGVVSADAGVPARSLTS